MITRRLMTTLRMRGEHDYRRDAVDAADDDVDGAGGGIVVFLPVVAAVAAAAALPLPVRRSLPRFAEGHPRALVRERWWRLQGSRPSPSRWVGR